MAASAPRRAQPDDAPDVGRLLHDFQTEYNDFTPGPERIAERVRDLIERDATLVVLAGEPPVAVAVLAFYESLWSDARECYLAELYVAPEHRGRGIGRAVLQHAIELARERGASWMFLGTSETDTAARALYEKLGFTNRENGADGPLMYCYEREL